MIIGNGLMGKTFKKINHKDYIFFVSGVSNSKTKNKKEFNREKKLLINTIKKYNNLKLIYLSTCDMYDSSKNKSLYLKHKINMENIIKKNCKKWIIFRVSQVIGKGGNENNLLYKLSSDIILEKKIVLYPNLERNLIHINDLKKIILKHLKVKNKIINIANPSNIKVKEIVNKIEKITNKKGKFILKSNKNTYKIPLQKDFSYNLFDFKYYDSKIKSFIRQILK